jgi:hypothetical protein
MIQPFPAVGPAAVYAARNKSDARTKILAALTNRLPVAVPNCIMLANAARLS